MSNNVPNEPIAPLHERVAALGPELSASERQVAEYMAAHPDVVAVSSAAELGRRTGTSDATVVRTTRALGYQGYRELKRATLEVLTRQRNLAATLDHRLGQLPAGDNDCDRVLADSVDLLAQMRRDLDAAAWQRAVGALRAADRVVTHGLGPAGMLADYLSLSLTRIGVPSRSITTAGFRLADDLVDLGGRDAVVVFAPIREFRETAVVLDHAAEVGATVILVTESLGMSLGHRVDVTLSTPQSTTGTASEITGGFAFAHAMMLAVAARARDTAVRTTGLVNRLRASVVGAELDVRPLPVAEALDRSEGDS
ncbi:MurR/RpiR family transcriptional regulator [Streptomyces mayteni]